MGAIIGGLYAGGMDAQTLEREMLQVDWQAVFEQRLPREDLSQRAKEEDFAFSRVLQLTFRDGEFRWPQGAVSSRSLERLLRRYTLHTRHLPDFDALPLPFRAVATNMETGQAVVLDQGDLAAALRASMSVPGVFAPLEWQGQLLGDGGLVNNLPVDVARSMGVDVVIAVNIGTPLAGRESLQSALGVTVQMINILTEQNVQRSVASLTKADLLLAPPLGRHTSGDFDQAGVLVGLGEAYGTATAASLARFAVPPEAYHQWQKQRRDRAETLAAQTPDRLSFVRIEGVEAPQAQRLQRLLDSQAGAPLDNSLIDADLRRLAATEDFKRLDYRLERDNQGGEGLVYQLDTHDWGDNRLRIGLVLQTDFQGQGAFNLRISHNRIGLNRGGGQWRNRLELGATVAVRSEWYQPLGGDRDRFVSAYGDHELRRIELFDRQGDPLAVFRRRTTRIGFDHGWHLGPVGNWGDVRLGWSGARRQSLPDFVNNTMLGVVQSETWTESALRLSVVTDQLDHANFPSQGLRFKFDIQTGHFSNRQGRTPFQRWELEHTQVATWGAHTVSGHLRVAHSNAITLGAVDEYALGGFHQLSGYRLGQVVGNNIVLGRLAYYHRLPFQPGVARALFAGATLELGNAWASSQAMAWNRLHVGSSLFVGADTGVGPVYLGLVHAPKGYTGVYFLLGRP
jgi:NTE family protein